MRRTLMASVAAIAVAAASPVFAQSTTAKSTTTQKTDRAQTGAQCMTQLNDLRAKLRNNEKFTQLYETRNFDRTAYSELIEAAQVLSSANMQRHCMQVVRALDELSQKQLREAQQTQQQAANRQGASQTRDQKAANRTADSRTDRRNADVQQETRAMDRAERDQQAREQLKSAKSLKEAQLSIEDLTDAPIRNMNDETLGVAEDVSLENGKVAGIIVSSGGFLGIGEAYYRVSYDRFRVVSGADPILVLDISEKQLKSMERVTKRNGEWVKQTAAERRDTDDRMNRSDRENKSDDRTRAPKPQ